MKTPHFTHHCTNILTSSTFKSSTFYQLKSSRLKVFQPPLPFHSLTLTTFSIYSISGIDELQLDSNYEEFTRELKQVCIAMM